MCEWAASTLLVAWAAASTCRQAICHSFCSAVYQSSRAAGASIGLIQRLHDSATHEALMRSLCTGRHYEVQVSKTARLRMGRPLRSNLTVPCNTTLRHPGPLGTCKMVTVCMSVRLRPHTALHTRHLPLLNARSRLISGQIAPDNFVRTVR
jgi:hypothetical protein